MKTLITSDHYPDIRYGIKFSKNNIGHEDRIYTFPYFCTFLLKKILWLVFTLKKKRNNEDSTGEHTAEKNLAKVPCKTEYNPIRPFIEKSGRSFFCQKFTSVENLAKNMFNFLN